MGQVMSRRDLLSLGQESANAPARIVHIASALVQLVPRAVPTLREVVATLPGAELHETGHETKFAVVLESAHERELGRAVESLSQIPGVLTVSIVAHLTEIDTALEEDVEHESPAVSQE